MSADNGIVTAKELQISPKERVVECPSGRRYRIRRIPRKEFIGLLGALPQVASLPTTPEETERAAAKAAAQLGGVETIARSEAFVAAALIEPRIGTGDGEIEIDDIPYGDLVHLTGAVLELNGMSVGVALRLRPTSAGAGSLSH